MSDTGHVVIHQEEDRVHVTIILIIAIVTVIVFGVGILWALLIISNVTEDIHTEAPPPVPALIGQPFIGMVEQPMFERNRVLADRLDAQRARLESYGFRDRQQGRIHIPIEEAMKRVVEGERP